MSSLTILIAEHVYSPLSRSLASGVMDRELENSKLLVVVSETPFHSPGMVPGPLHVMMASVGVSTTVGSKVTTHKRVRLLPAYNVPVRSGLMTTPGRGTGERKKR